MHKTWNGLRTEKVPTGCALDMRFIRTSCVSRPVYLSVHIRIKSGEPGFLGFSVPEWLGGVICKPEGAA